MNPELIYRSPGLTPKVAEPLRLARYRPEEVRLPSKGLPITLLWRALVEYDPLLSPAQAPGVDIAKGHRTSNTERPSDPQIAR